MPLEQLQRLPLTCLLLTCARALFMETRVCTAGEAHQQHPVDVVLNLPMLGGWQSFGPPTNGSLQFDFTEGIEVLVPPPPPCGAPPAPACPPCGDQVSSVATCSCNPLWRIPAAAVG